MQGSVRQALGLMAVSGLLFFTALGGAQLWDEDEPIFAGAAREMMARQEWIVPYFNSAMLPDKPVLCYWVMIAGYSLFGPTEFAARCGSALFGIGSVLLTWMLGRRLFSPRAGVWAGLALASSVSFDVIARAATPDAVLTFFCTLAIVCYVFGDKRLLPASESADDKPSQRRPDWLPLAGSYAAIGLAVLAKGPIGLILPVATLGLYSLFAASPAGASALRTKESSRLTAAWRMALGIAERFHPRCIGRALFGLRPLMGLAIVLAVAGPWYVAVGLRTEGAWLAGFLGKHNLERFLHPLEHHRGPFFYYLIAVIVGFFPWSLFLGPAALLVRSRLSGNRYILLLCWIGAYLVFFSLAATKLPNYIVPVYPALALLTGAWIDAWLSGECAVPPWLLRTAWTALLLVGVAVSIALPLVARRLLGDGARLAVIGLPLVAGGALCWWWHVRSRATRAAATFAASAVAFSLALFGFGSVEVGRHQNSRIFADAVRRQTTEGQAVLETFGYWRPSLAYYLGQPVRQMFSDEQVRKLCAEWPRHHFLMTTADRYAELAPWLPRDVMVLERGRRFLRHEELLLLGRDELAETSLRALRWKKSSNH